ncbi:phage portal protein [Shewanella sp. KX20019]|uniref:phage portal protein n=1 Tax=Shewanella sp. KX20019 TaxID=2803864 RepID=UPI0019270AD9|nr:phage portal protein [Shewanella sp. KX20019]QQX80852.1 phage portal protein [Shewanella sp. KX20019]
MLKKIIAPIASLFNIGHAKTSFEGASQSPRLRGKGTQRGNINTQLSSELITLQSRSRHACKNNPWAGSASDGYVTTLIGTGLIPRWQIENKELGKQLQKEWNKWAKEADADGRTNFAGLQSLAARTQFESGEVLIRFRPRRLTDSLNVPLQLQILPPDQLRHDLNIRLSPTRKVVMGIELNGIGKRTAYHIYKEPPGNPLETNVDSIRVNANQILHVFESFAPGQMRGYPMLSRVLARLYELDEYEDAELVRKKAAAMFAAFVTKTPDDNYEFEGMDQPEDSEGNQLIGIQPGAIHYMEPGESVDFSSPADVGSNYTAWITQQLRGIAAGIGITYETLTGDLSQVNYSSIRAGLMTFRRRVEALQQTMIIHQFCQPVIERWLDMAVASGRVNIPDYLENRDEYTRIKWIAPAWLQVDPLKAVQADKLELEAGLATKTEKLAERGRDIEDFAAELEAEEEILPKPEPIPNEVIEVDEEDKKPNEKAKKPDGE